MAESPSPQSQPVYREFTDSRGVHWRVWQVTPSDSVRRVSSTPPQGTATDSARGERLARENARRSEWTEGWLLFESPSAKKRLFPIPEDWTRASVGQLEAMCDSAKEVK